MVFCPLQSLCSLPLAPPDSWTGCLETIAARTEKKEGLNEVTVGVCTLVNIRIVACYRNAPHYVSNENVAPTWTIKRSTVLHHNQKPSSKLHPHLLPYPPSSAFIFCVTSTHYPEQADWTGYSLVGDVHICTYPNRVLCMYKDVWGKHEPLGHMSHQDT